MKQSLLSKPEIAKKLLTPFYTGGGAVTLAHIGSHWVGSAIYTHTYDDGAAKEFWGLVGYQ